MKKVAIAFFCGISFNIGALETVKKIGANAVTSVYDKYDPETILGELKTSGISRDPREKMTQMHRLDRLIPHLIDRQDAAKLCTSLTTIVMEKYPLSPLAKEMAFDYLWRTRPSQQRNKQLLQTINDTLDILKPEQIIDDINSGQTYSAAPIDIEARVNKSLEALVKLKDTSSLIALVSLIEKLKNDSEKKIVPGQRVMEESYKYLRAQEKQTCQSKRYLTSSFKVKKNDSDTED